MFKIRNKDGLFAAAGRYGGWTTLGKAWSLKGHVRSHITMHPKRYDGTEEVVEFALVEVDAIPMGEELVASDKRSTTRESERNERIARFQKQRAEAMLAEAEKVLKKC